MAGTGRRGSRSWGRVRRVQRAGGSSIGSALPREHLTGPHAPHQPRLLLEVGAAAGEVLPTKRCLRTGHSFLFAFISSY